MNSIMVSVVIPLYNAQNYIKETINSILNQTIKDLEIIVVDDGSTDDSYNIVKNDFLNEINRKKIILISQNNYGGSSARNIGMKLAKGKYISFVDADDILNQDAIEKLVYTIENDKSDLAIGNCKIVLQDKNIEHKKTFIEENYIYETQRPEFYCVVPCPLAKIYKTEIIRKNDIQWDNLRKAQDANFYYKYLLFTKKVSIISDKIGTYRVIENSVSHKKNLNILDVKKSFEYVEQFYRKNKAPKNVLESLVIAEVEQYYSNLLFGCLYSDRKYRKFITYYFYSELKRIEKSLSQYNYDKKNYNYIKKKIFKGKMFYFLRDLCYMYKKICK